MEYRQIVAVTGLGGLYQLMNTKNDGAIVRSLNDKSVKFVSARVHQVTPLESIEIYTYNENVRLHKVLEGIKEVDAEYQKLNISKEDNKGLRTFFKKALPDFDEERVYVSDIKKILKWYEILKANDLLNFEVYNAPAEETEEAPTEEVPKAVKAGKEAKPADAPEAEEQPIKKAAKKVAAPKEEGEKAPAKKVAKKSAVKEEDAEKPAKKTAVKKKAE